MLRKASVGPVLQEYLPADIQAQFSGSRELIRNIHNSFHKLRDRAEKMAERSKENATDLLMFGRELRYFIIKDIKLLFRWYPDVFLIRFKSRADETRQYRLLWL